MSQVNLLPPEVRQRQAVRRTASLIVAVGLAVLALIGVFFFMQAQKLADVESELEAPQPPDASSAGPIWL